MVNFLSIDYVMQTKERITGGENEKTTETFDNHAFYNHTCFPIFNISGF